MDCQKIEFSQATATPKCLARKPKEVQLMLANKKMVKVDLK